MLSLWSLLDSLPPVLLHYLVSWVRLPITTSYTFRFVLLPHINANLKTGVKEHTINIQLDYGIVHMTRLKLGMITVSVFD